MRLPETPLGKTRKRLAFVLAIVGACTFFLPMMALNPPLLGRTQWSPLDIAVSIYRGRLPVPGGHLDESLIAIALIYFLLLCALITSRLPGTPRTFTLVTSAGFVCSFFAKFWHRDFLLAIGWKYFGSEHMSRGPTWWILPWIMPTLLSLVFAPSLDGRSGANPVPGERDVFTTSG